MGRTGPVATGSGVTVGSEADGIGFTCIGTLGAGWVVTLGSGRVGTLGDGGPSGAVGNGTVGVGGESSRLVHIFRASAMRSNRGTALVSVDQPVNVSCRVWIA